MRSIACLTIVVALFLTPLRCYAQPPVSQSKSPQAAATAKHGTPPNVEITLKNGQKLKGRSFGRKYGADCSNCRVEVVQKGATQTIECRDVQQIDPQRTFWQKIAHGAENAVGVVLFVPAMLLLMIACRKDCDL